MSQSVTTISVRSAIMGMASAISVTRPGAAASIPLMDEVRAAVEAL